MAKTTKMVEVSLEKLKPYAQNAKIHNQDQLDKLKNSIKEFGFISPCLIDKDGNIIAGHGRVQAAKELGMAKVPCVYVEGLTEEQRRAYILVDNKLTELGGWDEDLLAWELSELNAEGFDMDSLGFGEEAGPAKKHLPDTEKARVTLAERFIIPPFTVLDSRQLVWQNRKRAWKALGLDTVHGRGNDDEGGQDGLIYAKSHIPPDCYEKKNRVEEKLGRSVTWDEMWEVFPNMTSLTHTSFFDPVLCEIAYRWFTKEGDRVIDPFAGGSVRGIVASFLGRQYTGVDLSAKQINANEDNWDSIEHQTITTKEEAARPTWIIGDSAEIDQLVPEKDFDFMIACPPYADLEVYSDDPKDISNMDYDDFAKAYATIIKKTVDKLKQNAFAFIVVGDVRDKKGNYRDFVSYTIKCFRDAGMALYNDAVLITQNGSAALIAGSQFDNSRKQAKIHQNVLIFADARNEIQSLDLEDPEETEKQINDLLNDNEKKLVTNHARLLTFINGDGKQATERLGLVNMATADDFNVEL